MNAPEIKLKISGERLLIAAVIFFAAAVWLAFLAAYLHNSIVNYKPSPGMVQEGDIVSAFLLTAFTGAAIFSLIISLVISLIYIFKYRRRKTV